MTPPAICNTAALIRSSCALQLLALPFLFLSHHLSIHSVPSVLGTEIFHFNVLEFTHPLLSHVAQSVKHLPAMWETWVQFLGQEDCLEKEMATHSNILAWRKPWTEEPGATVHGITRAAHNLVLSFFFCLLACDSEVLFTKSFLTPRS